MRGELTRIAVRSAVLIGAVALLAIGCEGSDDPMPVSYDEARAMHEQMLPELQVAMLPDGDAAWADDGSETLASDGDGVCRFSPPDSAAPVGIAEDDPGWDDRREAVGAVLDDHGFEPVGEPEHRHGAPAYGFTSIRDDGASIRVFTVPDSTVIRLADVPVDAEACEG